MLSQPLTGPSFAGRKSRHVTVKHTPDLQSNAQNCTSHHRGWRLPMPTDVRCCFSVPGRSRLRATSGTRSFRSSPPPRGLSSGWTRWRSSPLLTRRATPIRTGVVVPLLGA